MDPPCGIWPPVEVFFYAQNLDVASFSVMTIHQMSFLVLWNVHSRPKSCAKTPLTAGEEEEERRKKKEEEIIILMLHEQRKKEKIE